MHEMTSQANEMYGHVATMTEGTPTLTVGQRIRRAREAIGMGQNEMAKAVGVEGVTAYRWESDRATPSLERLTVIASILKVSVSELMPDGYDASDDVDDQDASSIDSPDEMMQLAELAIAAARGGIDAKLALHSAVRDLAKRLRASERSEKARG